ncbi:ABC transporter permease [Pseudomonas sp. TH49]|uniref:ABC transporter permease n=1 Tax=Pseudomonas TaxID=286 RepID=UPI001071439C|nr:MULTISPECIES: ABC transporter permease [Pseudomonas]MBK5342863.1 ABC transporter permease [Pseudomonas sp. TH49]QBR33178.1 ABC transporter permease [Pseudomonas sp. S150]UZT91364.1 ABC transporter permease [Pseudomonas koreensis]
MISQNSFISGAIKSLLEWRVWLYMGLQDIKARFRRSAIGPLWILINLAMMVLGAGVVYGVLLKQPMEEFLPYLTCGLIIWGFLVASFVEGGYAFVGSEGYIKQFSFPKQIYLLRVLVALFAVMLVGVVALAGTLLVFERFKPIGWLYALPGLGILLAAGLGHITLSAYLSARFRDLPHALTGIFQVLFFVTPIMFPVTMLKDRGLDFVYKYNPLYYLVDVIRFPILEGTFAVKQDYIFCAAYLSLLWVVCILLASKMDKKVVYML